MMQNMIDVCNPFDFSKVGDVELVTGDAIENFLAEAHQISREKGKQIPKHERILILRRTAGLMKNIQEFKLKMRLDIRLNLIFFMMFKLTLHF